MGLSAKIVKNINPNYDEKTDLVREQMVKAQSSKVAKSTKEVVENMI